MDRFTTGKEGTMKTIMTAVVAGALMIGAGSAQAETLLGDFFNDYSIKPEVSASMDFYDKYVWRGNYLDKDPVFQPGLSISAAGFEVGLWASYDTTNEDGLASDEQDAWVGYSYTFDELVTVSVGHTWYDFPEGNTSSKEVYASIGVNTLLSPTFSFYHDYEDGKANTDGDGNYYALDLGHSVTLVESYGITFDLAATVGYVDGQWLNGEGFHVTPTVGLTIPLSETTTMSPSIGYNVPLSGELDDAADEEIFGGVSISMSM